jgi:hypothetical protein
MGNQFYHFCGLYGFYWGLEKCTFASRVVLKARSRAFKTGRPNRRATEDGSYPILSVSFADALISNQLLRHRATKRKIPVAEGLSAGSGSTELSEVLGRSAWNGC